MSAVEHDQYRFCFLCFDFAFLRDKKCIEVAFLQFSTKSTQVEPPERLVIIIIPVLHSFCSLVLFICLGLSHPVILKSRHFHSLVFIVCVLLS